MSSKSIVYHRGHVSGSIRTLPFRQDSKAWFFKKWGAQIDTKALEVLSELYASFPAEKLGKNAIVVSFSNSLSRKDYIELIAKTLKIDIVQFFDIKNTGVSEKVFINDWLTWDLCRTCIPIIYFADDYRVLLNNYYWFTNRCCNDAIFDKNGNHLLIQCTQ